MTPDHFNNIIADDIEQQRVNEVRNRAERFCTAYVSVKKCIEYLPNARKRKVNKGSVEYYPLIVHLINVRDLKVFKRKGCNLVHRFSDFTILDCDSHSSMRIRMSLRSH